MRSLDVVDTYVPIRVPESGQLIGVMHFSRNVSRDVTIQVEDAKSTALWTTVWTMAGLFLVLFGFIVVADITLYRSRRREMSAVVEANIHLEDQVRQRTRELEESNVTALQATRAKSEFLSNMSHELRTPLNAIIGYSEMLQEEAEERNQESFVPDLRRVQGAGRHLLELVNGVLDLSRVEAGRMEVHLETFDISSMAKEVADVTYPMAESNSNTLEVHCDDNIGSMLADMAKVRQTLLNLLSNACKFTKGGTISLDVSREADGGVDWVSFSVTDTGIGIAREQIGRIFEPF